MTATSSGYVVGSSEGSVWDMLPGRPVAFKLLCDQTGGSIAVFEEVVPPGIGTSLHIHHTSDEVIYILAGEFTVRLDEESKPASAGAWIFIPRGSVHGWRNRGRENGRAFFIFTPGDGAKYVEEQRFLGTSGPEIDPAMRDALRQRHGFEIVMRDWE
jgi:quercetin dioxygenase-like cupin family protein